MMPAKNVRSIQFTLYFMKDICTKHFRNEKDRTLSFYCFCKRRFVCKHVQFHCGYNRVGRSLSRIHSNNKSLLSNREPRNFFQGVFTHQPIACIIVADLFLEKVARRKDFLVGSVHTVCVGRCIHLRLFLSEKRHHV